MSETYQFLRYYIPGSLSLTYLLCLIIANIDGKAFALLVNPTQNQTLVSLVFGAFAISPVIGYIIYLFYDWWLYDPIISKCKERETLSLLNKWAVETGFSRMQVWEVKKELIDFALYSSEKDPDFQISDKLADTIRGFWSHVSARLVSSIFAPIASFILFGIFSVIVRVLNLPIAWNNFSTSNTVITLLLIGALSACVGYPATRTIKEAFALEGYVIRVREKMIKNYMRLEAGDRQNPPKPSAKGESGEIEKRKANEDRTNHLASLVDSNYRHRKWSKKKLLLWALLQILAISAILMMTITLQPYINEPAIYVSFYVGIVAIYVALNTSIRIEFEMRPEEVIKWNYDQLKEKNEEAQPLLLALIEMKNRQPNIPLTEMIKAYPSLFDTKRLAETLYEHRSEKDN